jgi:hypothetical protein
MANSPSSVSEGELRHGVLGSADAIAQSLALLALTSAVSTDFLSAVLADNTSVHLGWFPLYCILLALILVIALADIRVSTRVQRPPCSARKPPSRSGSSPERVRSFGRAFETGGHSQRA